MEKKHNTLKLFIISIIAALVIGGTSGVVLHLVRKSNSDARKEKIEAAIQEEGPTAAETEEEESVVLSSDVSAVVKNAEPAVVSIECMATQTVNNFFFGSYQQDVTSSGTGFIIGQNDKEILIATNNHVIDGASSIKVTFCDDSTTSASVKGADPAYDLAVLAIDAETLDPVTLSKIKIAAIGNSESICVGSMVIAIGNSLGYGQSVTVGYIGALDREVTVDTRKMTLIQTDAAINPGNSGGPLLNVYGEVIGINSVKYASEEVEGMGYAIPITKAIPIIRELMNREELSFFERGYLGITGKSIGESYAAGFNKPMGVYVYSVESGSPADLAGIMFGDIITSIEGRQVTTMEEIQNYLQYTRAGSTIEIVLQRIIDGEYKEITVNVMLSNRP